MNRPCLTILAALLMGSPAALGGADERPTLSVLPFTAGREFLSPAETAELADDLASRLVETGRFRLLPREWLAPDRAEAFNLTNRREAARRAGVRYLVSASISGPGAAHSPAPTALSSAARAVLASTSARRSPPCLSVRPRQSFALVEARVIEAETGDIVRTSVIRVRLAPPAALPTGCARGSVVSIAARVVSRSRPTLDSFKSANVDIARHLVLPEQERLAHP